MLFLATHGYRSLRAAISRECAFQAAFLLPVGNLPTCSRRHRHKKWPVPLR
jgi:hypothetical protein